MKMTENKQKIDFSIIASFEMYIQSLGLSDGRDEQGRLKVSAKNLETVSRILAAAIGREKPWTWKNLRNILNGNHRASKAITKAIDKVCMQQDGMTEVEIEAHPAPPSMLTVKPLPSRCINLVSAKRCTVCGIGYTCYPAQKYCPRCGGRLERSE